MAFRVFDTIEKLWIKDDIYINKKGELFKIKQGMFGLVKLPMALDDRYVCHNDIGLYDKDSDLVYEGDYILAKVSEEKEVIGIVSYASELSSYVILCIDSDEFYTLGSEVTEFIKIIGNVFDGYKK